MHCSKTLTVLLFLASALAASCASYNGAELKPGTATLGDAIRVMGQPAMRWQAPDGAVQLAYPQGPAGPHTYMARFSPDGKLQRIENVLTPKFFTRIVPGMSEAEVIRTLGPSDPTETAYFERRDELVRTWLYCDDWNALEHFEVMFDRTRGTVRATKNRIEWCGDSACLCSH